MGSSDRKTAIVTGASEGIGQELSRIFAREGYDLVLVARNEAKLAALADELSCRHGIKARVIPKDLSSRTAPREIFDELEEDGVVIDTLVNNAGYTVYGTFAAADLAAQQKMIDVLIHAPVELAGLFLPGMVARGGGEVLNLASTGSFIPCPYEAAYSASKAFILSWSEAIAEELAGSNVTVTALCPGATRTRFFERSSTDNVKVFEIGMMTPEQVAEIGYAAMKAGKRYVTAGLMNKLLVFSTRLMPRALLCKVVKFVMQ
jgi:uncharacterized protein